MYSIIIIIIIMLLFPLLLLCPVYGQQMAHIKNRKHCTCFGCCLNHLHGVSVLKVAYGDVVQLVAADHWNNYVQCYIKLF